MVYTPTIDFIEWGICTQVTNLRTLRRWLGVLVVCLCCLIAVVPSGAAAKEAGKYTELDETIDLLLKFHLHGFTEEELIQYAIEGIIWGLGDPYTEHFTQHGFDDYMNQVDYIYQGTGLVLDEEDGEFYINTILEGSTAEKLGLQVGDLLVEVNGEPITMDSYYALMDAQLGELGESVHVIVLRDGELIERELAYTDIQIATVDARWLGDGAGYISLYTFSEDASALFAEKLAELKAQGLSRLILDLRDNSGGLIQTAQEIAGHFLGDVPLAYTQDRSGKEEQLPVIAQDEVLTDLSLIILVNEWSASASELLAGALQDYQVGVVIGEQTYGKGIVQQIYPLLTSGSLLKVTVQQYLTPNRHEVHDRGILPDIEVSGEHEQLLRALHELGLGKLNLKLNRSNLIVNDLATWGKIDIIRKGEQVFLPMRILASALGAQLQWDGERREVVLGEGEQTVRYPLQSLLVKDGVSYIAVDRFANDFPALTWNGSVAAPELDIVVK